MSTPTADTPSLSRSCRERSSSCSVATPSSAEQSARAPLLAMPQEQDRTTLHAASVRERFSETKHGAYAKPGDRIRAAPSVTWQFLRSRRHSGTRPMRAESAFVADVPPWHKSRPRIRSTLRLCASIAMSSALILCGEGEHGGECSRHATGMLMLERHSVPVSEHFSWYNLLSSSSSRLTHKAHATHDATRATADRTGHSHTGRGRGGSPTT